METLIIKSEELNTGNYILHNEERFLIESITENKRNKNFLFLQTTCNKKIELAKEFFIKQIIIN